MATYRKRPVEIEAILWNGNNWDEIVEFLGRDLDYVRSSGVQLDPDAHSLLIVTPEGRVRCAAGDWLLCVTKGEYDTCKDAAFQETYETVDVLQEF